MITQFDCVYPPHHNKYQVKPHSPLWFSTACAVAIAHRNHFFVSTNNKSPESKVKFRQASNCCKWVLEATKLAYALEKWKGLFLRKNHLLRCWS